MGINPKMMSGLDPTMLEIWARSKRHIFLCGAPLILSSVWCYMRCPSLILNSVQCPILELYPVSQLQFWNLTWYPQVEYQSSSTCIIECGTPSLAYPLFIIWWNINFDIGKTIRRCHFKTWHFVHFWIKHLSTNEPHRALIYTHEWPWALVCTETLKSLMPESHQWSWALISAHCGSWVLKCLIQK